MANREQIEGTTINNLYIEKYLCNNKYKCICKLCGGTRECRTYELKLGKYRACKECELKEKIDSGKGKSGNGIDLRNKQFGYWTVLRRDLDNGKYWWCKCSLCNREFRVLSRNLRNWTSKSCIECSQALKIDNEILSKQFKTGQVIKPAGQGLWECKCGKCGKIINRALIKLKNQDKILCSVCAHTSKHKDLTGQVFGNWEVIGEYNGNKEKGYHSKYLCRCSLCGNIKSVFTYNLTSGHTLSCGCQSLIDLKGQKINEWEVLEYVGKGKWKCKCSCGVIRDIQGYELRAGNAKSCGCKRWEYTRKLLIEHYGEIVPIRIKNPREMDKIGITDSKESMERFLKSLENKPTTYKLASMLDLKVSATLKNLHKYNLEEYVDINSKHSKQESEILDIIYNCIGDKEVILGDRTVLNGKELDIYIPSHKLAIEVNGAYWHSTIFKNKKYHQDKTIACGKKGIHLIHIFEYEWENENTRKKLINYIVSLLTNNKKILYARECKVIEIDSEIYSQFLDDYHLQNSIGSTVKLGLYYNNELIGIMGFSKPRFNNNFEYELTRLCWKPLIGVVGGAEKLFRYFINNYNPTSIITYTNLSKFIGGVYLKLGFKTKGIESITEPNYIWCYPKRDKDNSFEVINRYHTRKADLIEMGIGTEEQTEDEIMESLGYLKVYDSGNIRFEWNMGD